MTVRTLYKYEREPGRFTVSPDRPDCGYTEMYRLIADEGKVLVNGDMRTECIDVDDPDGWEETEDTEQDRS